MAGSGEGEVYNQVIIGKLINVFEKELQNILSPHFFILRRIGARQWFIDIFLCGIRDLCGNERGVMSMNLFLACALKKQEFAVVSNHSNVLKRRTDAIDLS